MYDKISSQLTLPFQETEEFHLKEIFSVLKKKFGLKKESDQKFIDLGSGNGQVVIHSALNFGIDSTGIEINENLVDETINRIQTLKKSRMYKKEYIKKLNILRDDFYSIDLHDYDYIYIFSLPTMQNYL